MTKGNGLWRIQIYHSNFKNLRVCIFENQWVSIKMYWTNFSTNKSFVFGFRFSKLNFMNKKVRLFKSNKFIWGRILILRHCNSVYSCNSKIHRQEFSWFCENEKKVGLQRRDGSGCSYYVYCSISINIDVDFGMITNENRVYGLLDRWIIYIVHFQSLSATISFQSRVKWIDSRWTLLLW